MKITEQKKDILIEDIKDFSLYKTFDCGQCFRFDPHPEGGVAGVAMGRYLHFLQPTDSSIVIRNCTKEDFCSLIAPYLSLDCNYEAMNEDIKARFGNDPTINKAIEVGCGIRILRQEHFETLISFIISQNNNIPRIKKIIAALCRAAGEKIGDDIYAFPTPEAIAALGVDGLFELKTGFRAKYIFDAATKVLSGELDLCAIEKMDTENALNQLMKIKGVGLKVASCVALFGYNQ